MAYTEKEKNFELYSFDIFDTLITRKTATPKGIFTLIEKEINKNENFSKDFRKNFFDIRVSSEMNARNSKFENENTREINFEDIYLNMQKVHSLSDENIEFLKNLELKFEKENLFLINENVLKIKKLVEKNKRVVLISDMYHSCETISSFLVNLDSIFENIKIYVSCEYKASKGDGSFYKIVKEKENVEYKNWAHYGDNENSDYIQAKKLGINAFRYDFSIKPYEKSLIAAYPNNFEIQKLLGISKYVRYNKKDALNPEKYDFGASFAAPMLYSYINYILDKAKENNFKTLYFIARDGYIPKIIADIIIKNKNLPVKTKYIYGSRLAWRIPNEENYEKIIETILTLQLSKLSINRISLELGISANILKKYMPNKNASSVLTENERNNFKNILLSDETLKNKIIEANRKRAELLTKYLKQEIDFEEKNIAFVDINGTGRTMEVLLGYMNKISPCKVYTFYITTVILSDNSDITMDSYFKEPKPYCYNWILELITRTDAGQTLGYIEKDNKIVPDKENINNYGMQKWGYSDYLEGIKDFVEFVSLNSDLVGCEELCYSYYDFISKACDRKTAEILGDIPYKLVIGKEKNVICCAPKLSFFQILKYYIFGKDSLKNTEIPELSLARSNFNNKKQKALFDFKFIKDFLQERNLKNLLKENQSKKLVFWGASIFLENFIKKYNIKYDNIVAICDRNASRHGRTVGKYKIVSPDELNNIPFDGIILTIKNRNEQIYSELETTVKKDFKGKELLKNVFDIKFI